jgi:hypothetical protein
VLVSIPHLGTKGEDRFSRVLRWFELGAAVVMTVIIVIGNLFAFLRS